MYKGIKEVDTHGGLDGGQRNPVRVGGTNIHVMSAPPDHLCMEMIYV
jgi:hypothetical protein